MTDAAAEARRHRRGMAAAIARLAILALVAAIVLVPLLATAIGGFKDIGELRTHPFSLPSHWLWSNYWGMLTGHFYWRVLVNSLVIALLTVALTLIVSSLAAFAFAHLHFFGMRYLLNYLLLGLLFPAATAILPLFIKVRDLGLLNTYWGVILPQVAFGSACRFCCCATPSSNCHTNCSTPRWSMAAAISAISSTSPCPCRGRLCRRWGLSSSSPAGTISCCR